jgi:hypothetical protein
MKPTIDLFIADEFSAYGKYTEEVVAELNKILQDEEASKTSSGIHPLHQLKKDILNDPNVYLSDDLLGKLYVEQNSAADSIRPTQK